jgi:hypothetical protein
MEKIINLLEDMTPEDKIIINKSLSGGPKGTRVIIKNSNTGEVLFDGHNKTIIAGSQFMATRLWGIDNVITLPNYNDELNIENNVVQARPDNDPIICLFCVGINGCGQENSQVYPVKYTNSIPASSLVPFRYEKGTDLSPDLREMYYGRKYYEDYDRYAYYFKTIDSKQLHLQYVDGTEILSTVYTDTTDTKAVAYVEASLKISKSDCRDIFSSGEFTPTLADGTISQPLTLGDARINSLSLISAWYKTDAGTGYKYYMQPLPVTEIHFSNQWLTDSSLALDIIYQVYY